MLALAVAFIIRLPSITHPPLETTHAWRQAFTNMVTRNLLEVDLDLLRPRSSITGRDPGVISSEFPAYNLLIAGMHVAFGADHWYGRAINLVITTISVWCFFLLVRRYFGDKAALGAAIALVVSSYFLYGRKVMPDAFSVGIVLIGSYLFDRGLRRGSLINLLIAGLLAALGGLCKIPVMVLLATWPLIVWSQRGARPLVIAFAALAALIAVAPVAWWYFIWQPALLAQYGNALYHPVGVVEGLGQLWEYRWDTLERFAFSAMLGYIPFVIALAAFVVCKGEVRRQLLWIVVSTGPPFLYFMARTGSVFSLHGYYVLPFVPVLALCVGVALSRLRDRRLWVGAMLLLTVEGLGLRWSDMHPENKREYLLHAEELADRHAPPGEAIATTGGRDPMTMYFLHRHGWSLSNEELLSPPVIDSLGGMGLKVIFVDRQQLAEGLDLPILHADEHWVVYRVMERQELE